MKSKGKKRRRIEAARLARRLAKVELPPETPAPAPDPPATPTIKITEEMLARSRRPAGGHQAQAFFRVPTPPPTVGRGARGSRSRIEATVLAMDEQAQEISVWAAGTFASGWFDGPVFMGYPALAILALLPEYRRMAEVLATECTRTWIKIQCSDSTDKAKLEKVTQLEGLLKKLDIQGAMRRLIALDAFFGRAHLYLDVGTDPDDRQELLTPIGNGKNDETRAKFEGVTGFLRGVKPIEPVWCYPARYNATNPLKDDWYAPRSWYVQSQEVNSTRLLRFIGREVPDLLKPAYMFGGVSLSQLMKPYVDRWIAVVQAVADVLVAFSTSGFKTNMTASMAPTGGGMDIFQRVDLYNNLRNNRSALVLDKDTEEFFQFNTPLSELSDLISKYQEFLCSISGEPVVKLLGIQPAGLNASSQGELTSFWDWCEAFRVMFCGAHLTTIIDFAMLSLWGRLDPDLTWEFESLRSLDPKEETEQRKVQAETDVTYIDAGVFAPEEIRAGLLHDPESPYFGLEEVTPDVASAYGAGLEVPGEEEDLVSLFPEITQHPELAEGVRRELDRRGVSRRLPDRRSPDRRDPRNDRRATSREPEPVG